MIYQDIQICRRIECVASENNDKILTIEQVLGHADLLSDAYLIHRRGQYIFKNPRQHFDRFARTHLFNRTRT